MGPGAAARDRALARASPQGESLRQLVVRSGVTQDLDTLEITVTPPDVLRPRDHHAASATGRRSERHLAPPKTSQSRGRAARGVRRRHRVDRPRRSPARCSASRCARRARCSTSTCPARRPVRPQPQPGVALLARPEVPVSRAEDPPAADPGRRPSPGSTSSTPRRARLPYLPDLLAAGHLPGVPGGRPRPPDPVPVRHRGLHRPLSRRRGRSRARSGWSSTAPAALEGRLDGAELVVGLPPGDVQRFRLASSLTRADLTLFGLWRILPPARARQRGHRRGRRRRLAVGLHALREVHAGARRAPARSKRPGRPML